ncbi:SDR family NAD(P)-dependent oxidoreductase [Streptomyces sp. NPDC088354]|uniref:SDR family NAD(P)-dependent oxidoreductase n=1 Tax=Streptomyces sp. NPDC088354 TaxID=3365856 RepID=UPI00380B262C
MNTSPLDLSGRRVLVTGAGSGIGRALALELAVRRCSLVLAGRRAAPLEETARLVTGRGGTARAVIHDLTSERGPEQAVEDAVRILGGLDVLVNNAGNVRAGALDEDIAAADIHAMVGLNLLAPILATRAALPHLRAAGAAHGHAVVLGIASGAALVGMPYYSVYAATKAGLARFDEALRRELWGSGVHVATAYPGGTQTPMMESSRAGADLGYGRRPVEEVVREIVAGVEAGEVDINTQRPERRELQRLNTADPLAVDAALAPSLAAMREAVRGHRSI